MQLSPDVIKILCDEIPNVILVYHFGSSARGDENSQSDIDLAVLASSALTGDQKFGAKTKLYSLLGKDVDLVDLKKAPPSFIMQVLESGNVLFSRSEKDVHVFEMNTISSYLNFVEERRALLEDIKKRGRVYE